MTQTTRDRLILAAAELFRRKGFHGAGLAEILAAADAPKGSLYHHFPNGKHDLALAASDWASQGMLRIIDDAFADTPSFEEGATTLCHKLAKFFDISGGWGGCPVSATLFDDPENVTFRDRAARVFADWTERVATHGARLGLPPDAARAQAELLMIGVQGAWILARASRSSEELRRLPARLYGVRSPSAP